MDSGPNNGPGLRKFAVNAYHSILKDLARHEEKGHSEKDPVWGTGMDSNTEAHQYGHNGKSYFFFVPSLEKFKLGSAFLFGRQSCVRKISEVLGTFFTQSCFKVEHK